MKSTSLRFSFNSIKIKLNKTNFVEIENKALVDGVIVMSYLKKSVSKQVETKIVDIFTKDPFQGNSLVVIIYGYNLSVEEKTAIIRELNAEKGVFIGDADDGKSDFKIGIFSQEEELDCDYQSLIGAAYVMIAEKHVILKDSSTNILTEQTRNGVFPLIINSQGREIQHLMIILDWKEMPEFRRIEYDSSRVAESLGISAEDLRVDLAIQAVKMKHWSMIIPVKSLEVLDRVIIDESKLINLASDNNVSFICLFKIDDSKTETKIHTRIINPNILDHKKENNFEDPITGESNTNIAAYIFEHKLIPFSESKIQTHFLQKTKDGRSGEIIVEMVIVDETINEIYIGGKATIVLDGKMKLTPY